MDSAPPDIPGAFGGSRLFDQPRWRDEAAAWRSFLAPGGGPALVEIGFDHGRRLTDTARRWPGWRVAGLEIRRRRVEEARAWAHEHALDNLLAWRADARTALAAHTPPASVRVIEILFPVPWQPETRSRRLLVAPDLLIAAEAALEPGGVLHLATDVAWYAERMDEAIAQVPALRHDPTAEADRPAIDALSRREWKHTRDGAPIHRRWLRKAADP